MVNTKTVYVVYASDADIPLGKLSSILQTLKQELRINDFVHLDSDGIAKESFENLGTEDLIVVLLTEGFVAQKPFVEGLLLKIKDKNEAARITEIIEDNVPYEPSFLAFPSNLEPIGSQENKDEVWRQIGESFMDMFPVPPTPTPDEKTWWEGNKRKVIYGIGIVVLLGLIYAIAVAGIFGPKPVAEFAYLVKDPLNDDPIANARECYIPCRVYLTDQSTDAKNLQWNLKDTIIDDEKQTQYVFLKAGEYDMTLIAINGKKSDRKARTLSIKSPPKANFEIENNGCTAPCEVNFKNTSINATKFSWSFPGAVSQDTSDRENPGSRMYNSQNSYTVTLKVENQDGIKSESFKKITILQDNSPFADFTYSKITEGYPANQAYQFVNQSQNAVNYIWEVSKVGVSNTQTYNVREPTHSFLGYGVYNVKLLVSNSAGRTSSTFKQIQIRNRGFINPNLSYLRAAERVFNTNIILPQGGNN